MRQTRLLTCLLLVAAAFAGCGKHATDPTPVTGGGSSAVLVASFPAARSTGVVYDTEIWGEFDRALDPLTVDAQSAFLKLDGQRVPSIVTYVSATRRIVLRPTATLQLQRTYTVDFSSSIRSADGVPLPPKVFFQFTTNSLRRVVYDFPVRDSTVGPVSMLGWGGSQGPLNELYYEVYAGPDSTAVANRSVPYLQRHVFTRLLPSVAWPRGSRVYWAVTTENVVTGERMEGPVQKFRVFEEGAVVESVFLRALNHGSNSLTSRLTQYCSNPGLPSGPTYNAALHWVLGGIPQMAYVVSVTVSLVAQDGYANQFAYQRPTLWLSQMEWSPCAVIAPGPPYPEINGLLAEGTPVDGVRVNFSSARLGAFFEAAVRGDIYTHGTLVRTNANVFYHSPLYIDGASQPYAIVQYVRQVPGAPHAVSAAAPSGAPRQALEKTVRTGDSRLDPLRSTPL